MHILAGRYKGRALKSPPEARLTSEKVKGAVFNILAEAIEGATFLDVCAGSGSIGLEALSRGAAAVTWIEADTICARVLQDNIRRVTGAPASNKTLLRQSAPAALRKLAEAGRAFDIIFMDPPYRDISLLKKALQVLGHHAILPDAGWLIVEHERRLQLTELIENIEVRQQYRYGDTVLSFCRRQHLSPP